MESAGQAAEQNRLITGRTSPSEQAIPLPWNLPGGQDLSIRSAASGLQHGPVTPLFSTLAADLYKSPEKTPMREGSVFLASFLFSADARWRKEAYPRYRSAAARWEGRDLEGLTCTALLDGARDMVRCAAEYYRFLQAEILPAASLSELLFTRFYQNFIHDQNEPAPLEFLLGFDSFPIRAEKSLFHLAHVSGENAALSAYLLRAPARNITAQMRSEAVPEGIPSADWLSFTAHFEAHLGHYGHALYALDFASPVPADDPAILIEMLRCLRRNISNGGESANPFARQHAAAARREAATQQMAACLKGPKKKLFRDLVDMAQRYAPIREDGLAELGLGWPVIRALLLALGRRCLAAGLMERADDIFWLTEEEAVQAAGRLDQGRDFPSAYTLSVQARRLRWQMEQRQNQDAADTGKPDDARQVSGSGVRAGRVTAQACALRGPADIPQMQPGCVMVIPAVTAGWSPLFALASAVVAGSGDKRAQHSLIIREYGIPAVLGVGAAAREIQDGQRVIVDGTAGSITLI